MTTISLLRATDLTFEGVATDTAVNLTASLNGEVIARGRTRSRGYAYLVVRFHPGGTYLNRGYVPPKVTVLKRTSKLSVALREAKDGPRNAVLIFDRNTGRYSTMWASIAI